MGTKPAISATDSASVCTLLGFVTEADVCALLGIELPTLRNRISLGKAPPSYKVGNRHLFRTAELDAWIRRRRVDKAAA